MGIALGAGMNYPARHRYHGETASAYDRVRFRFLKDRLLDRRERAAVVHLARNRFGPGAKLLEIGCGTGRITEALAEDGFRVTATDLSEDMIALARSKLAPWSANVLLQVADAFELPFPDNSFDGVVSCRLFGHLDEDQKVRVLRELMRVSRGGVVLGFPKRNALITFKRFFDFRFKRKLLEWRKPHWHDMPIAAFERLLARHGWRQTDRVDALPLVAATSVLSLEA